MHARIAPVGADQLGVRAALDDFTLVEHQDALCITHGREAVRDAQRILVMERGELVESGTHAELIHSGGRYARLHAMQA